MKAIVYHRYGSPDVLEYADVEKPVPNDDQVLIKIRAASINPYDRHFMRGKPFGARFVSGLRRPKSPQLGVDVSGEIEAAGKNVTAFKPGDEVFGVCKGSLAEFAVCADSKLTLKPKNLTFEQAASVTVAAVTALQALRDRGKVRAGERVLINGAAGGVGTFAVQIAKSFGAHVTGVCSTRNVEMVRSIGADSVIDYTQTDFTKGSEPYDVILDNISNHSLSAITRVLKPNGRYLIVGGSGNGWTILRRMSAVLLWSAFSSRKFPLAITKGSRSDLDALRDLLESGKITPVIDRRFALNEVPEAMRHLEEGHARGKVVITIA